jgi:hypothetical protein
MSEAIEFVIHGKIDGEEITPRTINFTRFNEFNGQVEDFVIGSITGGGGAKLLLDTVFVEVLPGSYRLRVLMSVALIVALEPVLILLNRPGGISKIDEKRARVVEKWQSKAKASDDLVYEMKVVRSDGRPAPVVRIGPETNYVRQTVGKWIPMETFLLGEIFDMGGEKPNVHIRLVETGTAYIVQTDKDTLRSLNVNALYKRSLLRVVGQQNVETGQFRDLRLVQFMGYRPEYEEGELADFIESGRVAWSGVPDASEWVRKLRGGT